MHKLIKQFILNIRQWRIAIALLKRLDAPAPVANGDEKIAGNGSWIDHVLLDADVIASDKPVVLMVGREDMPAARAARQWLNHPTLKPESIYHSLTILKMLIWVVSDVVAAADEPPFEQVYKYLHLMKQGEEGNPSGELFYDSAIALINAIEMDSGPVSEETIDTLFSIRWWMEYTLRWDQGERLRPTLAAFEVVKTEF